MSKLSWGATVPILLTLGVSILMQRSVLSHPELVRQWIENYRWYGIGVYVLIQSVTIIIAPLGGMFVQVVLIGVYGPFWGSLITYLVTSCLYLVNFVIARRLGRPWVTKLVGKPTVDQIDHYTQRLGVRFVSLLRVAQGNFDVVAYAAGLTNLSFRQFFWINWIGGIGGALGLYAMFAWAPSLTVGVIGVYVVSALAIMAILVVSKP